MVTIKYMFNCLMEMAMKKVYKLENLDCANCAAKMEAAIREIEGVSAATVSFMTQKLTIETDEASHEEIMKKVVQVMNKVEPDCEIIF